jgi:glycine cleavage system H protein
MIAILVLTLIVCALTVDYWVLRLSQRPTVLGASALGSASLYVDDRHMWLAPEASGLARVGIDEVASLLVGRPDRIEWATAKRIARGQALAVISGAGRRLVLRSPVDGVMVEHNPALRDHPLDLALEPLDAGWLVRLRPTNLPAQLALMRTGKRLLEWSQGEMARLRSFILERAPMSIALGPTAMDGGSLSPDVARHLDEAAFADAVRMLLPSGLASDEPAEGAGQKGEAP